MALSGKPTFFSAEKAGLPLPYMIPPDKEVFA